MGLGDYTLAFFSFHNWKRFFFLFFSRYDARSGSERKNKERKKKKKKKVVEQRNRGWRQLNPSLVTFTWHATINNKEKKFLSTFFCSSLWRLIDLKRV